jgi:deltex
MLKGKNEWIKCPVCSSIYGLMVGDQPPGSMTHSVHADMHCDGFPDAGTILIHYSMNSGKRGDVNFSGTHRSAYLPDTAEGREVLGLLE